MTVSEAVEVVKALIFEQEEAGFEGNACLDTQQIESLYVLVDVATPNGKAILG